MRIGTAPHDDADILRRYLLDGLSKSLGLCRTGHQLLTLQPQTNLLDGARILMTTKSWCHGSKADFGNLTESLRLVREEQMVSLPNTDTA